MLPQTPAKMAGSIIRSRRPQSICRRSYQGSSRGNFRLEVVASNGTSTEVETDHLRARYRHTAIYYPIACRWKVGGEVSLPFAAEIAHNGLGIGRHGGRDK